MIPKEVQDRINYHREALNKSESERSRLEKAVRTGNTQKEWQEFMNNPEFDEIRKAIDNG